MVGDITEEQWNERFEWIEGQGKGGYYMLVIDDGKRVVGTGALIVERKLYVILSSLILCSPYSLLSLYFPTWRC